MNFITKSKHQSKMDISISVSSGKAKEKDCTYITVRNGKAKKISKTGYASVAIDGEKLYFREESEEVGYKLSNSRSISNPSIKITNGALAKWAATHSGDYMLEYDSTRKLYFVDTE